MAGTPSRNDPMPRMKEAEMESRLVVQLQRLNGWRLWLLFSLATVVAAVVIVSLMDLILMGQITYDYLLTGVVTAGIVAPSSLFLLNHLLQELSQRRQQQLTITADSVEARLKVALDASDEGVLMVANDGRGALANKRFFELWRMPPELRPRDRMICCWRMCSSNCSDPRRLHGRCAAALRQRLTGQ